MVAIQGFGNKYLQQSGELYSWRYLDLPAFLNAFGQSIQKCGKTPQDAKVLDLGCGSGKIFADLISTGIKEENIYGIDIDEDFLKIAKKDYPNSHIFNENLRNFRNIPEISKIKFDLCISIHVLHFFDTDVLTEIFTEVHDVITDCGQLVVLAAHPMRWAAGKQREYFTRANRTVITPWGTRLTVKQHTMADYVNAMARADLVLENLWEPTPVAEGKYEVRNYFKYTSIPTRIVFEAKKNS